VKRISKTVSNKLFNLSKEKALQWAQQFDELIFLESNKDTQAEQEKYGEIEAILAFGAQHILSTDSNGAFDKLKKFRQKHKDFLFGYLSYDLKNDTEDLNSRNPDRLDFPELFFFQPRKVLLWKNDIVEFLYLEEYQHEIEKDLKEIGQVKLQSELPFNNCEISSRLSKNDYFSKVTKVLQHIHRGDIYEVNYCQEFYAEDCEINTIDVYQKLNQISQAPFASYVKLRDKFLLCASPERFVKKQNNKIIVQPIKGTARRLSDEIEDKKLAESLVNDPKERAENVMIVDLIRNDLSKNALKASVHVEELCKVYSFKQVHQLISTVVCTVDKDDNDIDIIKNLFPMGSMTGAPKISAMEIIEEEELTKRGLYSGAVGYFSPEGNFDFNVVIRSILYNASKKYVSFSVGSAITSLSVIENEYEECLLKAKALKEALTN
jgi:para-aminobenzoate synthetase component 1